MIFKLTPEQQKQLEELEIKYRMTVDQKEAEMSKYQAPDPALESVTVPPVPERPQKPRRASKEAMDEYLKAVEEYSEKLKIHNDLVGKAQEDWLNSASPEWRRIREELIVLELRHAEERRILISQFARQHFSRLGGDKKKILDDARDQANTLIVNRYEYYKRIAESGIADGHEVVSFVAVDLRVGKSNSEIWLDALTIAESIKESLKLHYEALKDDPDGVKQLDDIVLSAVRSSPYVSSHQGERGRYLEFGEKKKKKDRKPRSKKEITTFSEDVDQKFFMFSTTQTKDVLFNLLSNDGDVKETAQMINAVGKKKEAMIFTGENSRAIQVKTKNAQTIIEVLGSACMKISSREAKKVLHFIESELYQRTYYKGRMNDELVTFPLQKMVDLKLYTSLQNARRAFYNASNVLTALRVSATVKSGSKEISINDEGNARIVLFPTMLVENGQCVVRLNRDINWSPFLKDFFLMPDSWWSLPDNASDLEYKIFRAIRLNKDHIDENGKITVRIALSTVASWLSLPTTTKNPKRDVKEPIETAVKQIAESLDPSSFKIRIKTEMNSSLSQYLAGSLEITVSGAYTQNLIGLSEKQQERIERAVRRKEEIVKEASIRRLAEGMKNDPEIGENVAT